MRNIQRPQKRVLGEEGGGYTAGCLPYHDVLMERVLFGDFFLSSSAIDQVQRKGLVQGYVAPYAQG